MYIKRNIENKIKDATKNYPVIMVCGQRQVGKSTMLHNIKESNRRYVSLDDRTARRLAQNDPELFFETYGYPLLIDEFQRVPDILLEIKRIIDQKALNGEDNSGMFWLTGSQKFKMMKNISESLAGRVAIFEMSSLSSREINDLDEMFFHPAIEKVKERSKDNVKKDVHDIYKKIFNGGMPKLLAGNIDRDRYYSDYVNTYLERDIRELEQVGKLNEFYSFLICIASKTAQELNYGDISKLIGVSAPTVKSWITILERSGIIFIMHPYYKSINNRLVKTPKIYFLDTGLAAYLCQWPTAGTIEAGAMSGAFLETYVVSEIIKSYYNSGKPVNNLYYYRDIDQKEIDILIVDADKIYPLEVKKNKSPSNPDKNFHVLSKYGMTIEKGLILCLADELVPYNQNCWLCPISIL